MRRLIVAIFVMLGFSPTGFAESLENFVQMDLKTYLEAHTEAQGTLVQRIDALRPAHNEVSTPDIYLSAIGRYSRRLTEEQRTIMRDVLGDHINELILTEIASLKFTSVRLDELIRRRENDGIVKFELSNSNETATLTFRVFKRHDSSGFKIIDMMLRGDPAKCQPSLVSSLGTVDNDPSRMTWYLIDANALLSAVIEGDGLVRDTVSDVTGFDESHADEMGYVGYDFDQGLEYAIKLVQFLQDKLELRQIGYCFEGWEQ